MSLHKAKMLGTIMALLLCLPSRAQSQSKLFVHAHANREFSIVVNAQIHRDYGLSYPMTYCFVLPGGSSELLVYRRYSTSEAWSPVIEKTSADFFNGIEAVRFDYAGARAYLSIAFSSINDSVYLKITDQIGQNVAVEYQGLSRYYDNREAVVTVTADDWHQYFEQQFLYALNIFRQHNLWVSTAIVTEWCTPATWRQIQTQLDSGNVEAIAHGRNHLHVPYPDPAYEVSGSKTDIIDNLELPNSFRSGDREYVYIWVAPYGEYDDAIDALVSANQFLTSRVVYFGENSFSAWEAQAKKYAPVGVTREMGPLWGGSNNLADLNRAFDTAVAIGGVYHMMCHPHVLYDGEWSKPYTREHVKHISNRKNLWYASMGQLYLYHFLQDENAQPVSVAAASSPSSPSNFHLSQNYPNPFNPATLLSYQLSRTAHVRLNIYNALGQHIAALVDAQQQPGNYSLLWEASGQPSGTYYCQIEVEGSITRRKMVLLR